ncbi:uncharacterized protein MJAP1_004047 [Malassezia japonica]|uniref:Pinin/SDK/MemA protein domain-containing protein n=1 Tax=Malassezia japonica TaxID=223818 RepID=A0AAF0JCE0_9BASI|nr:uncharacterized protein MJAP1_004047 [Malassezia japonica]WFD41054.1 hypothetical protein MJAP1_004047 [Malassezia japonica]
MAVRGSKDEAPQADAASGEERRREDEVVQGRAQEAKKMSEHDQEQKEASDADKHADETKEKEGRDEQTKGSDEVPEAPEARLDDSGARADDSAPLEARTEGNERGKHAEQDGRVERDEHAKQDGHAEHTEQAARETTESNSSSSSVPSTSAPAPAPLLSRARAEDRQRGKRMLGLLNSTLSQSREPRKQPSTSRPAPSSEALAAERAAHDAERAAIRSDTQRLQSLSEEIAAYETAYRTSRAHKRRLSSFLVTHIDQPNPPRPPPLEAEAAATRLGRETTVPLGVRTLRTSDVYYLPRKLLPEQEDVLDAQEERVDDDLDVADDEYDRVLARLEQELHELKVRLRGRGGAPTQVQATW